MYAIRSYYVFVKQKMFGFSEEDIDRHLVETITSGKEPIGSMGFDSPLAILSDKPQHLSNYFKQHFAQVSNPPIDPLRERIMMSLNTSIGRSFNILSTTPAHCKQITFEHPVVTNEQLEALRQVDHTNFRSKQINAVFEADGKPGRLREALRKICKEADKALLDEGINILIISDRNSGDKWARITSYHVCYTKLLRTSPIGDQAPPALAAITIKPANHKRNSLSFTIFCKIVINTIVAVRLSMIADNTNPKVVNNQSNFVLLFVFINPLIVEKPSK